jgi:hypothetical protein
MGHARPTSQCRAGAFARQGATRWKPTTSLPPGPACVGEARIGILAWMLRAATSMIQTSDWKSAFGSVVAVMNLGVP